MTLTPNRKAHPASVPGRNLPLEGDGGTPAFSAADSVAAALGACLLDLYPLALNSRIGEFEERLFALLHDYIAFDSAWFGRSTMLAGGPLMHNNYVHNLGPDFIADWEKVKADDPIVPQAIEAKRNPVLFSLTDDGIPGAFRSFCARHALAQIMCTVFVDPVLKLWTHLSLYRNGLLPRHGEREAALMSCLMPHLAAALNLNRLHHLQLLRMASRSPRSAVAICDGCGVIQYADSTFADLMLSEWPGWGGAVLPQAAKELLAGAAAACLFIGAHVTLRAERAADLLLIHARLRSAADLLTPKELAVVRLFGEGLTYKAVARRLELSPATVRHHLRRAYAKLHIRDKGEIAWLLNQPEERVAPQSESQPLRHG